MKDKSEIEIQRQYWNNEKKERKKSNIEIEIPN